VNWLGDQQASSRLIAETRAGRNAVDVWTFSLGGTLEVQKRGLLQKVDWRSYGAQDRDIFFDGEAVANHNYVYAPIFAKSKLGKEQVPRAWEALLDAQWTDKLVSDSFLLPRLGGYLAIDWGLERTEKWIKTLIEQRKLLVASSPVANFLKSGERQLAVAESTSGAFLMNRDGLNVGYQIMEMVPATQFVLGAIKQAPHPNAARLLVAWLLSPEAKMLYEQLAGQPDIRANSQSPLAQEIKAAGSRIIYEDVETMNQRADYYRKLVSIVRGQG
jgi:iron(III) transport system substrate-binding protein